MLPWIEFYKTHHLYQNQEPLLISIWTQWAGTMKFAWHYWTLRSFEENVLQYPSCVLATSWLEISIWRDFLYGQFKNTQFELYPKKNSFLYQHIPHVPHLKFNSESPLFKMMGQEDDPASYWDPVSFQGEAVQLGEWVFWNPNSEVASLSSLTGFPAA